MWRRASHDWRVATAQSATRLILLLISIAATAAGALWVNARSTDPKGAQSWEIVLGAIGGIIVGPLIVGIVLFIWNAARAPFRQRDAARNVAERLHREAHPEF